MLQALIRTKDSSSYDGKRRGDVICVKLKEFADWGAVEIRVHQPVDWIDADLESEMRSEYSETGIAPIRITPYLHKEEVEFIGTSGVVLARFDVTKTRSTKYLDIDSIENTNIKNQVIGDGAAVELNGYEHLIKDKTTEELFEEFESNKSQTRRLLEGRMADKAEITETEEIIKALNTIKKQLRLDGISIDIIDGKFVEVEE